MSTLSELQVIVARALRDVSNEVFSTADLTDMINSGITVVSNMAPRQYMEDIESTGESTYAPLDGAADERLELRRVEIWTSDLGSPAAADLFQCRVPPAAAEYSNESQAGWDLWGGTLYLPKYYADLATSGNYFIRIWGYAPFTELVNSDDDDDLTNETRFAVVSYATMVGYERLEGDRALFQKWQAQQRGTDASVASLMNVLASERQRWERLRRQLIVLRERP